MFTSEKRFEILYWLVVLVTVLGLILIQPRGCVTTSLVEGEYVGDSSFIYLGKEPSIIPNSLDLVFKNKSGEIVRVYENATDSFQLGDYVFTNNKLTDDSYSTTKITQSDKLDTSVGDLIFISEEAKLSFGGYVKIGDDSSVLLNWNNEQYYFPIDTTLGKTFLLKTASNCYMFKLKSVAVPSNKVVIYFESKQPNN